MKKLFLIVVVLLMTTFVFTPFARADEARIWTDKDDYSPSETVTIFGEGFLPNEQVTIMIKAPDLSVDIIYAWTNRSGAFSAQYVLDGKQGTYMVTASDGTNIATTTFTDRVWSVSVSPTSAAVPLGGSATATVSVTANPAGGPEVDLWAAGQPDGVTVSFSPSKGVPPFTSIMSVNVSPSANLGTHLINIVVFTGVPGNPSYSEKARTSFTLTITGIPPSTVSITVTSSPVTGEGFVKVDSVLVTTPATFSWTVGSTHTLEALSPVPSSTGMRYVWTSWSDGGAQTHTYVVQDFDQTITAYYKTQYYLTVSSAYGTTGGEGWYDSGQTAYAEVNALIVSGSAGTRYVFINWSGDASGNTSPSNPIVMDAPKTAVANWKTQYEITVTASPSGALGGTFKVTYTQCGTTYANVQKTTPWTEWTDADTVVAVSEPQNIVNGYQFNQYSPSSSATMTQPKTIILVYVQVGALSVSISPSTAKIKVGESMAFTSSVSGGLPSYSYQWYLNGSAVSGATSQSWTFTPTTTGYFIVYLKVTDSASQTVNSNEASVTVAPQLVVSISPMSASILVGQSVDFSSTVSGGYLPYSYQWYLNDAPVSGATSSSWNFTPATSGIYYVYLKVTDANNNVVQSATARISVASVSVGGYSISLAKTTPVSQMAAYAMLIVFFAALLSVVKRGRKLF
ncbi:MAG: PKD domain-containing protein [Candidatus Bathyarchaeia archaeon]